MTIYVRQCKLYNDHQQQMHTIIIVSIVELECFRIKKSNSVYALPGGTFGGFAGSSCTVAVHLTNERVGEQKIGVEDKYYRIELT